MCHGISGNAYTFLALYRATRDPVHLLRATFFASFALDNLHPRLIATPDHPYSLFEGVAALAVLCCDLHRPMQSFMPAYEL